MSEEKKKKSKPFHYRGFYEEQTGEPIPNGFHVHHIDGNRRNNHILNLVALPHKLHTAYHFAGGPDVGDRFNFHIQESSNLRLEMYQRKALIRLLDLLDDCAVYVDKRNELLGWDKVRVLENDLTGGEK